MAEINASNCTGVATLSGISLSFLVYHCYKFDKCRCLIPRKNEWFRVLLTWMLVLSNIGLLVWAVGWAYVKYQLGWVMLPVYGARPWPSALFPHPYTNYNAPLTACLSISYSLQYSLNAEEGLYWWHLMNALKSPHTAKAWLGSVWFYLWIAVSVCVAALQAAIPWIGFNGNLQVQIAKELLSGGIIELIVLAGASIVLFKFPKFLDDVRASGAGPEVRSRLHYYHEANKVRTFFRLIFCATVIILGGDGITEQATINTTPMAADILIAMATGSLLVVMMISIMLYLPRSYGNKEGRVMVAQQPHQYDNNNNVGGNGAGNGVGATSGLALISLLREGGQWDADDDLRLGGNGNRISGRGAALDGGNAIDLEKGIPRKSSWNPDEKKWNDNHADNRGDTFRPPVRVLPNALENFTSPIAIPQEPRGPVEIRIHVEREVHQE